jgi:hypothetical protein
VPSVLIAQRRGGGGHQHVLPAGVDDEQQWTVAIHPRVRVDVVVDQAERKRGLRRAPGDRDAQHAQAGRRVGRERLPGQERHRSHRQGLQVLPAMARVHDELEWQLDAIHGSVVGEIAGGGLRADFQHRSHQQVRRVVEPRLERKPALGRDVEDRAGTAAAGLVAGRLHRRATEAGPPPQVGVLVRRGQCHRQGGATLLEVDLAVRTLLPDVGAVETFRTSGGPEGVAAHGMAGAQIGQRGRTAGHALPR